MTRAERIGTLVVAGAIVGAWVAWWLPTLAVNLACLTGRHARFRGEMVAVDVLFALRRDRAARGILARSIRRNRRGMRAARRRARDRRSRWR